MATGQHGLIVFVKNPVEGKVKTRLAKSIGPKAALKIYQRLLRYTAEVVAVADVQTCVYYSHEIQAQADAWDSIAKYKRQQQGDSLGSRMLGAFRDMLSMYGSVVIIGSDCPEIKAAHIYAAFGALDKVDCVIGPAADGGYYLLGMKALKPFLFEGVNWSSALVLTQTVAQLVQHDMSFKLLETLTDLDHHEDLLQVGWDQYI